MILERLMVDQNAIILAEGSLAISWVHWEIRHQILRIVRILIVLLPSLATDIRILPRMKTLLAEGPLLSTCGVL